MVVLKNLLSRAETADRVLYTTTTVRSYNLPEIFAIPSESAQI